MKYYTYCQESLLRSLKSRFFQSLSVSPNSRSFWSAVNKIRKKPVSVQTLLYNGISASTPQAKADVLNEYFSSCFNKSCTPLSAVAAPSLSPVIPVDFLCSSDEVLRLILNIPLDTAPGSDGISSPMIHHTAHSISLPLSLIFNSSLSSGIFPSDWKNSFVTPIPKSKSSSSSPSNFRPISLLPLISKVLERHVFNYMYDFCLSHKLLSDSQFGFRPGFSTETALLSILHSWHTSLDSINSVCSVFFDLTKAFDSVPHKPRLSAIDLPSALLIWLNNYLFDRSQQVVVNGSTSSKSHVSSGVPQGSPISLGRLISTLSVLNRGS